MKRQPVAGQRRRSVRPKRRALARAHPVPVTPARFDADPEQVEHALAKLVLSLVEFLRQVMERQAVRRMEEGTLAPPQVEAMGLALMQLETTLHDLAARFGLSPADLNLDLGPLGRLT